MPYTRPHPPQPPLPPGERILGQCRAQSRAGDPLPARWENPQSCTCVSPPHSRSRNRREGRVHSPLQPAVRPPTTILLPALPVSPPTYPPSCLYMRDPLNLDAILLRFSPGNRNPLASRCSLPLPAWPGPLFWLGHQTVSVVPVNELDSLLDPLRRGPCRCVALRCIALHWESPFVHIHNTIHEASRLRLHHRRPSHSAVATKPPTPGPTAQFRVCRHPAIPHSKSLPRPDDPDLIGTEQSHNKASAAPRQLHRVHHS